MSKLIIIGAGCHGRIVADIARMTADYDEKNYFDIEKFLDHKLELREDDEYEVIDVTE